MSMDLVIDARELRKHYPGSPPVLRGATLSVEAGEMVAVMGPSGCGKSTMLHVLGLLHAPDSGRLHMLGTDVMRLNREEAAFFRRRNLGFVMQSSNLFDFSTVYENVEFPLIYDQVPVEQRRERILRALELVHLSARVHYRSNRLSGGEQQRVAIARAMVNNPRILFADEPTGALDTRTSRSIMTSFRALAHNAGVSMVVVTHDPTVAEYCDAIYTLDEGRLVCRKKEPVPPPEQGAADLMMPELPEPARLMNLICVGGRVPRLEGTALRQLLLRLYDIGIVSKLYSSCRPHSGKAAEFAPLELPMPIRHVGLGGLPAAALACMRHLRGNSSLLWRMWRELPARGRLRSGKLLSHIRHFMSGVLMARWCLEDDAEMLHALSAGDPATSAWVAGGLAGLPFSFTVRAVDLAHNDPALPVKIRAAAFVRCDTEATRNALRALCPELPAGHFLLLRGLMVFPDSDVQSTLEERGAARGGLSILAVGSLTERKGLDDLLRACALLRKEGVPFRCRIVGSGHLKHCLRFLVRRLGVSKHVEFCGQLPHDRVRLLLGEAGIFVAPGVALKSGEQDGLPTALIEAMQCALPIIATDLPGHAEIIQHTISGLIVPQSAPREIADAILALSADPERARALGQAARAWVLEHLNPEAQGEEIVRRWLDARVPHAKKLDENEDGGVRESPARP